jgi:hypothetical protein
MVEPAELHNHTYEEIMTQVAVMKLEGTDGFEDLVNTAFPYVEWPFEWEQTTEAETHNAFFKAYGVWIDTFGVDFGALCDAHIGVLQNLIFAIHRHLEGRTRSDLATPPTEGAGGLASQIPSRLSVGTDRQNPTVTLDGVAIRVTDAFAALFEILIQAHETGDVWVSGPRMKELSLSLQPRPDRVLRALKKAHPDLHELIESGGPKGYRIKPGYVE